MLASLPYRLRLADKGPRDLPERQQTLRAALDWSYRLLDEREQALFARLGVFVGGCGAEAALEVAAATAEELAALADQSLLRRSDGRFDMLETAREYALDRLGDDGDGVRARHAAHFAALAEAADPEMTTDRAGPWVDRLELEHANLRAAITWAGRVREPELELRIVTALTRFWIVRGHLREGRAWLDRVAARPAGQPEALRARALDRAAALALRQGDYPGMRRFAGEGLELFERLDDKRGIAQALDRLATAAANEGDHARSAELYERSQALSRELGDEHGLAVAATNIGCLALMDGDLERAVALSLEGLALYERVNDRDGMLQPLNNLAHAALLQGRHHEALARFREGQALALEVGYVGAILYCLEGMAAVHAATGDAEQAARLLGAAQVAAEQTGMSLEPFEQDVHERTVAATRAALGDAYEAAVAAGRELDLSAF
jgi:non-specific serine/threonine protein kinase